MQFYNVRDLSYLLKKDCSVVITGDSLSYNRYDFVEDPRMNAWDCPFAMESWSFLIRDYLISHSRGWKNASDLIKGNESIKTTPFAERNINLPYEYRLSMKDKGVALEAVENTSLSLKELPENLCFIRQPDVNLKIACSGKVYDLTGDESVFGGMGYKWLKCEGESVELEKNRQIYLAGASDACVDVHLTGSGSKTAEWLLENYDERIGDFDPDLCIVIIGANNRRMKDPESFKKALYALIKRMKAQDSEILLIFPPHSSTTDPAWDERYIYECDEEVTRPIIDILKEAVKDYNLPAVDLFEFFRGVPNEKWRFDNTHFTKNGNIMLYNALVEEFFGGKK